MLYKELQNLFEITKEYGLETDEDLHDRAVEVQHNSRVTYTQWLLHASFDSALRHKSKVSLRDEVRDIMKDYAKWHLEDACLGAALVTQVSLAKRSKYKL